MTKAQKGTGLVAAVLVVLAACAPAAVVQPRELTVDTPYDEAFVTVARTISLQPGWFVAVSDQSGGVLTGEQEYEVTTYRYRQPTTTSTKTMRVAVTLTDLGAGRTAVTINRSKEEPAGDLEDAIVAALRSG